MASVKNHDYQILPPSIWPLATAVSLFTMLFSAAHWFESMRANATLSAGAGHTFMIVAFVGFAVLIFSLYSWWASISREANAGEHTPVVRIGVRYSFMLFITSEVMVFGAFFWAFFKYALHPMAADGSFPLNYGVWPPEGVSTLNPWHLPLVNTILLVTSGAFCTWAHHAIVHNERRKAAIGLAVAIGLGWIFTMCQAYEYYEIVHGGEFSFSGNVYGAVFFMATGLHGAHVLIGSIFLLVCLIRLLRGAFTPKQHLGFEMAAWYWHFVDVVWLFLFVAVYIWGAGGSAH
ncbi:cytochrome c oxidase subunit III [Ketogulonicigenium robustum]|uniref:cytochrome-c oxidase n=1 Tax=Ketogulonicigenium robustum TaxID=92947 RepID=A0A1W6NXV4_9RHOB|nr:cytochrome c oxidase subunit 3 [Ketogulonicigenium robustum]ARO13920.1 cytochrome c oxidase subunit III [Ketogulonicigenium robustum]